MFFMFLILTSMFLQLGLIVGLTPVATPSLDYTRESTCTCVNAIFHSTKREQWDSARPKSAPGFEFRFPDD